MAGARGRGRAEAEVRLDRAWRPSGDAAHATGVRHPVIERGLAGEVGGEIELSFPPRGSRSSSRQPLAAFQAGVPTGGDACRRDRAVEA